MNAREELMKANPNLWLDKFDFLEFMSSEEMDSLLKSNRISWEDRRIIKFHSAMTRIKELIPVIAVVGIASAMFKLLQEVEK